MIKLTLDIENVYEDGEKIKTTVETEVPDPPATGDSDDDFDWSYDHIFPHTGTGKTGGDAFYFVTVRESSHPGLIPVGTEYEFGL